MRTHNVAMNFAHTPGLCGAAVSTDGAVLITGGSDASVRAHDIRGKSDKLNEPWWVKNAGSEPEQPDMAIAEMHEKPVNAVAIAVDNKTMATGSDDGFVRIFSLSTEELPPEDPKNGSNQLKADSDLVVACARFGGPVRALDFSPTGAFLGAAGEEPGVLKIIMTAQPTNVSIMRCGEKEKGREAIVALAFDPMANFVATVGELGSACVWSLESGTFLSLIELNDRLAKSITWAPDGSKLVVGTNKGAVVVNSGTWVFDHLLKDAGDQEDEEDDVGFTEVSGKTTVSAVSWSSSGRYLLTGGGDARVALWDVEKRTILNSWKAEASIQRIIWHPKVNAFIIVDEIGQFGIVPEVVPSHLPGPFDSSQRIILPQLPEDEPEKSDTGGEASGSDDDNINVVRSKSAKAKKEKKNQKAKKRNEVDEEGDGGSESSDAESRRTGQFQFAFDAEELEADDEDEPGTRGRKTGYDSDTSNGERDDDQYEDDSRRRKKALDGGKKSKSRSRGRPLAALPVVQSAFMPSSTPLQKRSAQKKRILCWNLTGAVLSFDETTHDVVEVEFADATRRSVGIKDHFGYSIGCLTTTGVLLGASKTNAHGSLIYFRPFSSWATNSDWTQFLQGEENAVVLALGKRFAAVGTTPNNILRMFSLSGIQTDVCVIAGPIVTLAAYEDHLAVVFGVPGTAMLRYELLEISDMAEVKKVLCAGDIVISPGSKLEWVGFTSNSKEFAVYDSAGNLYLLCDMRGARRWVPMIQKAASFADCDWFWVAAVNSDSIVGAPCHSHERFPPAKPRPALRTVPLSAPVIQPLAKNGKPSVAERFFRSKVRLNRARNQKAQADEEFDSDDEEVEEAEDNVYKAEVEVDKCLLALMEEACRHEQNLRAFDLATRLHTKVSFKYAVDLANYFKRTALATRVEEIARQKIAILEEEEREKKDKKLGSAGGAMRNESRGVLNSAYQGGELAAKSEAHIDGGNDEQLAASAQANAGLFEGVSEDEEEISARLDRNVSMRQSNGNGVGSKRQLPQPSANRSQKSVKAASGATPGSTATPARPVKNKKGVFTNRFKK